MAPRFSPILAAAHTAAGVGPVQRALVAGLLLLSVASAPMPAWGGDSHTNGSSHRLINQQRVEQLKQRVAELRERLKEHKQHQHNTGNVTTSIEALQAKVASLETSITTLLNADSTMLTALQAAQTQIAALQARIVTLESRPAGGSGGVPDLEKYVSIDPNPINGVNGPHLIFRGVNVHVQSGSGTTVDTTGLGNLIIGYNETDPAVGIPRNGSHNLVGGQMNAFSSSGGVVFGLRNAIRGQYAAILGGERNIASGVMSSVLGGGQNTASGQYSTVFGGQMNTAPTPYAIAPELQAGGG
ncbi:hypothetical protein [Nitrospira moscoviensis]|uniref:Uncharacterized protein n=1 Tax=Nitrospira moscoviensis TaxID=42253 RepID=A0A0K2GF51_NITMO|nr:hypothetical protein [Nitrospira moscoviensis]ALA59581.1 hypothetical protein NITMOv2_3182 [Nitrospira moscoviensis]